MNIDIEKTMILIKGKDLTHEIRSFEYKPRSRKVQVTYKSGNSYPYDQNNVTIINYPKIIELNGCAAFVDDMPVYEPKRILDFGKWIRIIKYNGGVITVGCQSFSVIKSGVTSQSAQEILKYLKDISQYTSDDTKEEAFLKKEMEQITFVHPESVLSSYLNQKSFKTNFPENNNIIFPFQFNLSQKAALENALTSSISVIEGPPGTGKTQTILNIIANLIGVQGKSVAVVSNNNEAVKNVIEKMAKQDYGFLTALLGKGSNQDMFFSNMPTVQVEGWNCKEEKHDMIRQIETLNTKLNRLLKLDRKKAQLQQELRAWRLEQEHFEEYYVRQEVEKISKLPLFKASPDRIVSFLADISLIKDGNLPNGLLYRLRLLFKYGIFDYKRLKEQEISTLLMLQKEFYRQQILKLECEIDALNILSSVMGLYGDKLPCEILREHYRCHPQIIEFCNQKYYDGKLIPYSDPNQSEWPLVLYKTSEGNHMRKVTRGEEKGNYNQRELDVIVEEVLRDAFLTENYGNIGFVTPYRKQANKAEYFLSGGIQSDTVHKYQGREKNIMIMSTVLDTTREGQKGLEFVDEPHMVNVAVSRAIKQFILVTDHDLFLKKGKDIGDLIRYIQYSTLDENIIESQVISVFDLLYRQYSSKLNSLKAKMNPNARYRSEEATRVLLNEILSVAEYKRYSYVQGVLLRNLLNTVELLTTEELEFVNNRASLDFVVFHRPDKVCALVIEVDGFAFHENNPEQLHRDALKDTILAKYQVPILRLASNGSKERERIQKILSEG